MSPILEYPCMILDPKSDLYTSWNVSTTVLLVSLVAIAIFILKLLTLRIFSYRNPFLNEGYAYTNILFYFYFAMYNNQTYIDKNT